MATLSGITSGYTITARARITSITGTTAFKTDRLRNKAAYYGTEDRGAVSIDIDNSTIEYGTITSITIKYSGRASNTIYDTPTGRTGYINGSGHEIWAGEGDSRYHEKAFARKSKNPVAFSDTWTNPPKSDNGKYRFLIGVMNEQEATHIQWAEVTSISLDITYTPASYKVTWQNHDGTVLETDTGVSHGATPTYNGATPTKSTTAQYTYAFNGWKDAKGNSVGAITGDTTYTAQFTATPRKYEVKVSCKSDVNPEQTFQITGGGFYTFDSEVTIEIINMPSYYEFNSWVVWGSAPQYFYTNPIKLKINNELTSNGKISVIEIKGYVDHTGFPVTATAYPENAGEVFPGNWLNIDGEENFGIFANSNSMTSEPYIVEYQFKDNFGVKAIPINEYYRFINWEAGITENPRKSPVNGAYNYLAYFEKVIFEVIFLNDDDSILATERVYKNSEVPIPQTPTHSQANSPVLEYSFLGWYKVVNGEIQRDEPLTFNTKITEDCVYQAVYLQKGKNFKVKITNGTADFDESFNGGAQIDEETFQYPACVIVTADERDGFEFSHWEGEMPKDLLGNTIPNTTKQFSFHPEKDITLKAIYNPVNIVFKNVKICYPSENDIISPTKPIIAGDRAYLEIKVALEIDKNLQED